MGIEKFFGSLNRNKMIPQTIFPLTNKLVTRYLLIDFNSIVHVKSRELTAELNKILYNEINKKSINDLEKFNKKYNANITNITSITQDELDNLVIKKVIMYIIHIITNYINPDNLEYFYIAVDGTPSKAKMIEQKKRRYMNYVIYGVQEYIFNKHSKNIDNNRLFYEKSKYIWNTGNITPGTLFMSKLEKELTSEQFIKDLHTRCKILKEYIFSGTSVPGEAEKKIVNYVKNLPYKERTIKSDNIIIYSPDSDVIILSMLLHVDIGDTNRVLGLKMLRHNQQKNTYDYVDIDIACEYLFKYICNKLSNITLNKDSIIMDICFMFTIFGNDFVPKIESYDVHHYFDSTFTKYMNILKNNFEETKKVNYIIKTDKNNRGKVVIEQQMFLMLIKELHIGEARNLQMLYLLNNYSNIEFLVKMFGTTKPEFIDTVDNFFIKLRKLSDGIRNGSIPSEFKHDTKFIDLAKHVIDIDKPSPNSIEFLNQLRDYYNKNNKFPNLKIKLIKYDKSINSPFHKKNLEKTLDKLDPKEPITEYDKEKYKFDNMLDEYQEKMNAYPSDIGKININTREYSWKSEKIQDEVSRYYRNMGINNLSINDPSMKTLVHSYLEGLMWVFQSYFNSYDDDEIEYGDIWYYKYDHTPLLTQLYYYLRDNSNNGNDYFLSSVIRSLKQYKVPRINYFNPIQQLLYVTPPFDEKNLSYVPIEYRSFFKKDIYKDMNKLVNDFLNNKKTDLDCRGALFISKCHIHNKDFAISDNDFMYEVNKINSKKIEFPKLLYYKYTKTSMERLKRRLR